MWCVVGLGNPGSGYRGSRHNVGFLLVDQLCRAAGVRLRHRTPLVTWGEGSWRQQRLLLAKPLTYMNRSGIGVHTLMRSCACRPSDLVVLHDDLDLALGRLKFKQRGGDGGHRGIRSIINALGCGRFLRLRIGIGRPPSGVDPSDYVLNPFTPEERALLERTLEAAVEAVGILIQNGVDRAMSLYHGSAGSHGGDRVVRE
jgi:PTH1 family peptidyl-tRNA hydrolase